MSNWPNTRAGFRKRNPDFHCQRFSAVRPALKPPLVISTLSTWNTEHKHHTRTLKPKQLNGTQPLCYIGYEQTAQVKKQKNDKLTMRSSLGRQAPKSGEPQSEDRREQLKTTGGRLKLRLHSQSETFQEAPCGGIEVMLQLYVMHHLCWGGWHFGAGVMEMVLFVSFNCRLTQQSTKQVNMRRAHGRDRPDNSRSIWYLLISEVHACSCDRSVALCS